MMTQKGHVRRECLAFGAAVACFLHNLFFSIRASISIGSGLSVIRAHSLSACTQHGIFWYDILSWVAAVIATHRVCSQTAGRVWSPSRWADKSIVSIRLSWTHRIPPPSSWTTNSRSGYVPASGTHALLLLQSVGADNQMWPLPDEVVVCLSLWSSRACTGWGSAGGCRRSYAIHAVWSGRASFKTTCESVHNVATARHCSAAPHPTADEVPTVPEQTTCRCCAMMRAQTSELLISMERRPQESIEEMQLQTNTLNSHSRLWGSRCLSWVLSLLARSHNKWQIAISREELMLTQSILWINVVTGKRWLWQTWAS